MIAAIIKITIYVSLMACAIFAVPIFVEIHRETDSVLESLAAALLIILLTWLLLAAFVGIIVFPYYVIAVLLRW